MGYQLSYLWLIPFSREQHVVVIEGLEPSAGGRPNSAHETDATPASQYFVPRVGLEPTRLTALVPKTSVATITPPRHFIKRLVVIDFIRNPVGSDVSTSRTIREMSISTYP